MDVMTLREAAQRTSRSVTTLRRYIRSGRLKAEKRAGRFGPEYFVTERSLSAAGLETSTRLPVAPDDSGRSGRPDDDRSRLPAERAASGGLVAGESVPISLYQELQMKHEQLLVQYGMVRASGMHVFQLKGELEAKRQELEASRARMTRLQRQFSEETERLNRLLRRTELDQQGRGVEVAALREKVQALEMLTRNAVTNETIEKQFSEVMSQARRVDRLQDRRKPGERRGSGRPDAPDH